MSLHQSKGWVLYDGMCGFCSWWIPFWEKTIKRTVYGIAMLQDKWVRDELKLPGEIENHNIILFFSIVSIFENVNIYLRMANA